MYLIRFSVNHPVTTCMLMLALLMGGMYSFSRMKVELLPSISIPTLVVLTDVPKTSPGKVHREVTLPLEESLNGVSNLVSLNSISLESSSRVIMEFDWGSSIRNAEIEVREAVNSINLPGIASKPLIKKIDPSSAPIFRFDIRSPSLSTDELRAFAEDQLKSRLQRIDGVGEVEIIGGTDPEFQIIGNRAKLEENQLTVLSLVRCINEESANRKSGAIEIEDGKLATLRILGKVDNVKDLEALIVAIAPSGSPIRIRDVATVVQTNKSSSSYARIDGLSSVGISIRKTSEASIVSVVKLIKAELDQLSPSFKRADVSTVISQDDSEYVLSSQSLVFSSIIQGVVLAGLLLFFFLRDVRATLIVALVTPVSLMAAMIVLNALGLSRNVLILGGMGLAAGMTLDSSIVLIESIYKQLGHGLKPKEAAIRGASEVASGIFSSTMTTVVAFLPILLIPGLMSEMFRSLAHAVIWTVVFSMVVGLLFIPMISARVLGIFQTGESIQFGKLLRVWNAICNRLDSLDRISERFLSYSIETLQRSVSRKILTLVLLVGVSIFVLKFLPGRGFLPPGNVDELWIRFEAPAGVSLDYVDQRMKQVESLLQTAPYSSFVRSVSADIRNNEAKLLVRLFPNRKNKDAIQLRPRQWHSLSSCLMKVRAGCESLPDLAGNTYVTLVDKIRGDTRAPIIVKIFARNSAGENGEAAQLRALRSEINELIVPEIKKIPGAIYQRIRLNETPREILISTNDDREALLERGLTSQQISDTVRASVYGVKSGSVFVDDREIDITVFLEDRNGEAGGDFDRESIESLGVRSLSTGLVHQVKDVAQVSEEPVEGSMILERTNRKPTVNLESHFVPYDIGGETVDDIKNRIVKKLAAIPGFSESFGYQLQGEAKDTEESFSDATLAFLLSVILIYMIMCAQFEGFSAPLAIMITVPLAAAGSVFLLNIAGEINSLGAYLGAVILCGVVVNNGIILVEYVNILRRRGRGRNEAIIEGSIRKLRSIIITSLTSIMGMAPLVVGVGEGTELYRGVASVIVGGLVVSTPLTLIALPLLYSILDEASEFTASIGLRLSIAKEILSRGNL